MSQILFKNCQLLDPNQSDLKDGYHILVENEFIKEVSDQPIKTNTANIFDLKGKILMPGLIDGHVHAAIATMDIGKIAHLPRSYVAIKASKILEGMLMRGFTSVRDAGGADFGLAKAVADGHIRGPRLFISGKALSQTGGHGDFRPQTHTENSACFCSGGGDFAVIADGVPEVRKAVREQLRKGAHQIKIMASGGVASPTDPIWVTQFSKEEIQAIVEEAAAWNTYVMAHAYTSPAIRRAIECGARSIEHGNLIDEETANFVTKNQKFVVPTLVTYEMTFQFGEKLGFPTEALCKLNEVKTAGLRAIEICKRAGVKIGHGSDLLGELHTHQSHEFLLRSEVLSAAECIRSATIINAEMMNMSGKLGVIAPGAFADLLVVDGNPLTNLELLTGQGEHLLAILKNGVFYKNELAS